MRVLDDVCDMLEDEIKQIVKKDDITPSELDSVYKSVDIIKDIKTIEAMEDSSQYGYSRRPYYSYDGPEMDINTMPSRAMRGRDADSDGRYSERRDRDSMGRYMSREGGYTHEDAQMLKKELDEMRKKLDRM